MDDIKVKIKIFLSKIFRKREIGEDEDIFTLGSINSLFAMQLVFFLEKEFRIRVEKTDLDMNNFRTINAMVNFIERKTAQE